MSGWTRKQDKTEKPCGTIDTLIGAKTEIRGDLQFSGGLRIDGHVKGNISGGTDNSSMLILSEHAVVTGDVTVPHMIVNGVVKGNVRAVEHLELQEKAEIQGDIYYKSLQMALGARINGKLIHESEAKTVSHLKPVEGFRKPNDAAGV